MYLTMLVLQQKQFILLIVMIQLLEYLFKYLSTATINVSVFISSGGNDIHLIKDTPIVQGSALQIIDGGARFVLQSGDALKVQSDTASSADVWVSIVDDIST